MIEIYQKSEKFHIDKVKIFCQIDKIGRDGQRT
jgi:hypothetical protein